MSVEQAAKAKLEGYSLPQTETGRSSLVPSPRGTTRATS